VAFPSSRHPEPERVFLTVGGDPQGDDETLIAEMHAVDQQRDEIEAIKGRTLPGRELRGRAGDEAAADRALAGPTALHLRPDRLQAPCVLAGGDAHQHLLDDAVERVRRRHGLKRRQRHLAGRRPHARALIVKFQPPRMTSLRVVPARLAGRSGSCAYRGPQIAVRSSSSIVVKTFSPERSANSNSSVLVSTSRSTSGR
jgi:hypothetical protein